jgi:hypothetical protein
MCTFLSIFLSIFLVLASGYLTLSVLCGTKEDSGRLCRPRAHLSLAVTPVRFAISTHFSRELIDYYIGNCNKFLQKQSAETGLALVLGDLVVVAKRQALWSFTAPGSCKFMMNSIRYGVLISLCTLIICGRSMAAELLWLSDDPPKAGGRIRSSHGGPVEVRNGIPQPGAKVVLTSGQGWSKQKLSDDQGRVSYTMICKRLDPTRRMVQRSSLFASLSDTRWMTNRILRPQPPAQRSSASVTAATAPSRY